jgi:hypothetical protein
MLGPAAKLEHKLEKSKRRLPEQVTLCPAENQIGRDAVASVLTSRQEGAVTPSPLRVELTGLLL